MFKLGWLTILSLILLESHCQTYYSYSSTSNNIVNLCHCDLTKAFCDYNCCCDSDCAESVKNALKAAGQTCTTNTLESYCFDASYYAKVNVVPQSTTISGSKTCYSFSAKTVQAELSISDSQMTQLVKSKLPDANSIGYTTEYSMDTTMLTTVKLVQDDGSCLNSSTDPYQVQFSLNQIKFGRNLTIRCANITSTCQSSSITLFSQILGANVSEFFSSTTSKQIPQSTSSCLSTLTVLIFYNLLGEGYSSIPYIVDIRNIEDTSVSSPTYYTLNLRFIDLSVQLQAQSQITSPGFFPQIPPDMFYPIFYSWSQRVTLAAGLILFLVR